MSAGLLKPSVADEDTTHTKLHLRQQQQARYYNRGACELDPLEKGNAVRDQPWQVGKKECVVPENIHTPTTEGIGNSEGVGGGEGSKTQEIPVGRGIGQSILFPDALRFNTNLSIDLAVQKSFLTSQRPK